MKEQHGFRQQIGQVVIEAVFFLICILPGLYLSSQALQDPWLIVRVARSSLSWQQNHVATFLTGVGGYRSEHIGGEMMQVALVGASDLPLEAMALLPVGSLLLAISYYAVAKTISPSRWTAMAITIYASWFYPLLYSQYGTHTYAWTHVLFLTFLLLFILWLRSRRPMLSALIMLVFLATFLHYHTTPLWIMAAITTAIAGMKIKGNLEPIKRGGASWAIALFCIVLYFAFDTIIYGNGLARLSTGVTDEAFAQSIITRIITPLFLRGPQVLSAFEVAPLNPVGATLSTLVVWLTLTIPIVVWCCAKVYRVLVTRQVTAAVQTNEDIIVWSIVMTAVAHWIVYSAYGTFSLRVIPVAFPFLLPLVTHKLRLGYVLERFLASTLALFAIIGFLGFMPTLTLDITASQTGLVSNLFQSGSNVMGDPNTYGSILLNSVKVGRIIDFLWLDSDKYASVAGDQMLRSGEFDYLVADTTNRPIITLGWSYLQPWTHYLTAISQNRDLDKIYDSENLSLFQPSGKELPDYELKAEDVEASGVIHGKESPFWLGAILIAIFFLPGFVGLLIAARHSVLILDDLQALSGLAIGLSVTFATFVGYLTNFSPLGLAWFVPLSIGIPGVAMMAEWILHRQRPQRVLPSHVAHLLALVVIVLVWASLALSVADSRITRRAEFTEFFVTRNNLSSEMVTFNVVNRLNQPQDFAIAVRSANLSSPIIGQRILPPGSIWNVAWKMPMLKPKQQIVVSLERNGIAYRKLKISTSAP